MSQVIGTGSNSDLEHIHAYKETSLCNRLILSLLKFVNTGTSATGKLVCWLKSLRNTCRLTGNNLLVDISLH